MIFKLDLFMQLIIYLAIIFNLILSAHALRMGLLLSIWMRSNQFINSAKCMIQIKDIRNICQNYSYLGLKWTLDDLSSYLSIPVGLFWKFNLQTYDVEEVAI